MLWKYICNNCGAFVNLLIKVEFCQCPLCGGNLTLHQTHDPQAISNSITIQRLRMDNGKELLAIASETGDHAFQRPITLDDEWQPIDIKEITKPYQHCIKAEGRVF